MRRLVEGNDLRIPIDTFRLTIAMSSPSTAPEDARAPLASRTNAHDDAFNTSSFDLGPPKPAKLRACATHHPTRKTAPSTGVEAILFGHDDAPFDDGRQKRGWNDNRARQHAGANLFGASSPAKKAHESLDAVQRRQQAVAPTTTAPRSLTLQELRQACRARQVNPGGSRDALIERLEEAIKKGLCEAIPANAAEAHKSVGAGARYVSKANEIRASSDGALRESQKIWRDQIRGNDIFGTSFVDAPAVKKMRVEGPSDTLSFAEAPAPSAAVVEAVRSVADIVDEENIEADAEVRDDKANKRKRAANPIVQDVAEDVVAAMPKAPSVGHRATAWASFQGAGLFSEEWTAHDDVDGNDENDENTGDRTLVKSTTTSTGTWKTIEEEEEEQAEEDAAREADEAVAEAERDLAEELANTQ